MPGAFLLSVAEWSGAQLACLAGTHTMACRAARASSHLPATHAWLLLHAFLDVLLLRLQFHPFRPASFTDKAIRRAAKNRSRNAELITLALAADLGRQEQAEGERAALLDA